MADHTHPITPPPDLIEEWRQKYTTSYDLARQAARWGADLELEAGRDYMQNKGFHVLARELRAARRPKPPSLAEQALDAAEDMSDCMNDGFVPNRSSLDTIRRALERLKELEQQENND